MQTKRASKPATATLTVRVPLRLRKRLDGLSKSTATNRSRLAVEALETYVEEQEAQLGKIDHGLRDADAGRVVSHGKVKRYLQSWGRKRRLLPPRCK